MRTPSHSFQDHDPAIDISVVIPVFNEKDSLNELMERLARVLEGLGKSWEILVVNDGSRDGSGEILNKLSQDPDLHLKVLTQRTNFGKAQALARGFEASNGEVVITMDGDLQDIPEEIPAFLAKLDQGWDLVSGWKVNRQDPLSKTFPSKVFNGLSRAISSLKLHDFNCGFKAYRWEALQGLSIYGELHRFIPILVASRGFRVTEIPVKHHARDHGRSKYGSTRFIKGFLDLITVFFLTRYLQRPGHFFGGLGFLSSGTGFCILAYLSALKLIAGEGIGGRPLFFLGILLLLLGAQLFTAGILGELIVHGRHQVIRRKAPRRK